MKTLRIPTAVLTVLLSCCLASAAKATDGLVRDEHAATQDWIADGNAEPNGAMPVRHVPNEILVKFRRNVANAIEVQLELKIPAGELVISQDLDGLNARYHIRGIKPIFKDFRARRQQAKALRHKGEELLNKREKRILRRLRRAPSNAKVPDLGRIYKIQVELEPGQSLEQVVAAYNDDPDVEYAELNYIVSLFKTPNDPRYFSPGMWALDRIDAPEAWDVNTGSSEIVVAVIDTGVDYTHRDLVNNMWVNEVELGGTPGADDDGNGYIDDIYGYDFENQDSDPIDDNGHGTHCAGTIAAVGNNGLDVTGVCWNAKIMAIKYLGADGGTVSDAASSFYYAVENGADVTSNSWGTSALSQTEREAIEYAHSQGVITVAAAGNDNSSVPFYPAADENAISVAATNSNDEKASFSNYGDWVDIAAPGVDILSLRADGTLLGTPYDQYTTASEGTSMACPHIAGACALLLSHYPTLTCDEVYDILIETVDPIAPGICLSNGRVNLLAMLVSQSRGQISLDHGYYTCSSVVSISLSDHDLEGSSTQQVTLATSGGDLETVLLTETVPTLGVFTGTISTTLGDVNMFDGSAQIAHDQIIVVTYYDDDDGTGNPAVVTDTAIIDCEPPVIFNVHTETASIAARIMFETDEPTTGRVRCAPTCGGTHTVVGDDLSLAMAHTILLTGLSSETTYYFVVDANDVVGQQTTDDNYGVCYSFVTGTARVLRVPSEFSTIQAAIDEALWYGDTVLVADRIYQGDGNRDIDFRGKAITLSSENGPENCIIDCQGTEPNPHRGFHFYNAEAEASILDGFTIIGGHTAQYDEGGAIKCIGSSPTIKNCIFSNNWAGRGGGIYNGDNSSPTVSNCTFIANSSESDGGGMYNRDGSSPTLTDCNFIGNSSTDWSGGGIRNTNNCNPILSNCTFTGNSANNDGGGMDSEGNCHSTLTGCTFTTNVAGRGGGGMRNTGNSNPTLTDCTFTGNVANDSDGGGLFNYASSPTVINCTFVGNSSTNWSGGGMRTTAGSPTVINCIFGGNSANHSGGGIHNSDSYPTLTNCTLSNNSANTGGGIGNYSSYPNITNCILWANSAITEGPEIYNSNSNPIVTYCDIKGWTGGGTGNIDADPLFVDEAGGDCHLQADSPCIDAGDPDFAPDANNVDIDGDSRVIGGRVDMGADEYLYTNDTCWDPYECAGQAVGDATCDGKVDLADLFALKASFGKSKGQVGYNCCADFTHDEIVDLSDLSVLKASFGSSGYSPSTGDQNCPP